MEITYRKNAPVTAQAVADLFRSSGIRRPVDDLPRMQRMIDPADFTLTAWDGDVLVGIARTLTDWSHCAYLSDLAVRGEYQKQGIGKELMARTRTELGDEVMLLLLSAPNAMSYYPHTGYTRADNAWLIPRKS